jgi:hypothetical protein
MSNLIAVGSTAATLRCRKMDKAVLYVAIYGRLRIKVHGTLTKGGKVIPVNTTGFKINLEER